MTSILREKQQQKMLPTHYVYKACFSSCVLGLVLHFLVICDL